MTKEEFGRGLAYLSALFTVQVSEATARAYWDLLRDLPIETFRIAARRAGATHDYKSLPTVALIRRFAAEHAIGHQVTAIEAWDLAIKGIVRAGGIYADAAAIHQTHERWPVLVSELVTRFGWRKLADNETPDILRGQWRAAWDALEDRHREIEALPQELRPAVNRGLPPIETLFRIPNGETTVARPAEAGGEDDHSDDGRRRLETDGPIVEHGVGEVGPYDSG